MANYVKSTNFTAKDTLVSGDPLKKVKGTEIDVEFNAIATAISSKADAESPTFTGTVTAPTPSFSDANTTVATVGILKALYPIGSVYINAAVATNPATLLGFGTWTEIGAGRVLVGQDTSDALFDTLGETGGSKDAIVVSHNHSFSATTDSQGAHEHNVWFGSSAGGSSVLLGDYSGTPEQGSSSNAADSAGAHTHSISGTTSTSGSSGTNANLQPYIVVKMWQRVS